MHGIKRLIHVSTDEVYGEGAADQEPMFEDQVLEPTNPYAATKAGAEFIAKSYSRCVTKMAGHSSAMCSTQRLIVCRITIHTCTLIYRSFGLPIVISRSNNIFGPHQYPEKLIPKFINLLMRDRPLTLHGNGLNTRNFLYVRGVSHVARSCR